MPRLTDAEVRTFLDEPGHLVRIGTVDADGFPRVVPTWFVYDAGRVLFTPRGTSVFLDNLRRDPRVALSVDEEPLPYRKVTVQGEAVMLHDVGHDDVWRDTYRRIACRYIPEEAADAYIQDTIDQPRALLSVSLANSRVSTWRMPVGEEQHTGIWARRYYVEGTHMAELVHQGSSHGAYA